MCRSTNGSAKEKVSLFGDLAYVDIGNGKIFSKMKPAKNTYCFQGGKAIGYNEFMPVSALEEKGTVKVGVVIYFRAK